MLDQETAEAIERAYWSIMQGWDCGALHRLQDIMERNGMNTRQKPDWWPSVDAGEWWG
jgi:hypothetical protein